VSQKTPQAVLDFGFRRANELIVHAGSLKQVIVDECRIARERLHVVPHVSLTEASGPVSSNDDSPTVLFFGRIWEYKGLEYLIRAEPVITARVPGATIVIAGEGEDFGRYRRLMVHPDRFVVHNEYVVDEHRTELFRRASVVVLPYIEASQSGVIPIAYSLMKPVVATTVGGLPDMVEDGRTGYLVPPRDVEALADAIVRLLRDPALRAQMGACAKRKLDAECAPRVVARKTRAVYDRAVAGSPPPRSRVVSGRAQRTQRGTFASPDFGGDFLPPA